MRSTRRTCSCAALLAVTALWIGGCDRAELDPNPGGTFGSELQPESVRAGLTEGGIGSLFSVTHPDGLAVDRESKRVRFEGRPLSVGPVSQSVPVDQIEANVRTDRTLELEITTDSNSVTVPVRLNPDDGTRICRFRLDAVRWKIDADAKDDDTSEWSLELVDAPDFDTTRLRVQSIGSCPLLEAGEVPTGLEQILTDYLEQSAATGVGSFVDVPIYQTIGLFQGRLSVRHVSSFANRQGAVEFAGASPESGGIRLDRPGLRATLDAETVPHIPTPRRQSCVPPPEDLPRPEARPAGTVDPAEVRDSGAELGVAISRPLVSRMVRSAALGGFLCQGMDPGVGPPTARLELERESADLGDVGLRDVPVRGRLETMVKPSSSPELELRAASNAVEMTWEGLTIELYGRRGGTPVKVLAVTVSPRFVLRWRPAEGSNSALRYEIEALSVQSIDPEEDFESPWADSPPGRDDLEQWTEQLLVLTFDNQFDVPLPLSPNGPLDPVGVEIRSNDVLLLLRIESG